MNNKLIKSNKSEDSLLIYAESEGNSNQFFASGFLAPDPFVFFAHKGKSYLLLNELEYNRGKKEAAVDEIVSQKELEKRVRKRLALSEDSFPTAADLIEQITLDWSVPFWLVPADFDLGLADSLRGKGVGLKVREPFFPERRYKTDKQINFLRSVQEKNEKGLDVLIGVLREAEIQGDKLYYNGEILTSEYMKRLYAQTMLELDCTVKGTIVASGLQSADPHDNGGGPLLANVPIIIDLFPQDIHSRYWADMTRTVVKGRASAELKQMWQTVYDGQRYALERMAHGVDSRGLHQGIVDLFIEQGFVTEFVGGYYVGFIHGTGHGVGLDIHESPRFSPRGDVLESGMVVTVEPGLYYPEIGGVRLEDTVVVRDQGIDNLARYPKFLEID
jgi:Xaa-Pro aminopeptidase